MNTQLFLSTPTKWFNLKTLKLEDTSNYCGEEIRNYIIEVLPVNRDTWVTFHVQKEFDLILNSSNLGYKKASESADLVDLPDGIYEFKQSYKPNIHTMAKYYHMRTVAIDMKYGELLCAHFQEECKKDERVFNQETIHLAKIRQYIDGAQYAVAIKHDKEDGIKFYNQAVELIQQFENDCGCV